MLFLLAFLGVVNSVEWYQQKDLSDFHLQSVISRDCYRGTYGSLSLFTCPLTHVHLDPFTTLSNDKLLCVVEASNYYQAAKILALSPEVDVLWEDEKEYFIIGGLVDHLAIHPTICSRSEFGGAAKNVYTVSSHSIHPYASEFESQPGAPLVTIQEFLANVSASEIQDINTKLAYGDPNGTWNTRNSYGTGATLAVNWTLREFQNAGASAQRYTFRTDMCDNLVAEFRGTALPNEIIVLGAHLDSRSTQVNSPTQVAPGADDNGTGTAIAVLFARIARRLNASFRRTIRLMTFCGEEQGLVGSRAIASSYRTSGVNVVAMYNVDMVGYRRPAPNNFTVLAFMTGSTNANLTSQCRSTITTYLPTVAQGTTSACCSDQQAFHENNFPALGLFETNTSSVVYPDYHQSTDTPDKVNFQQVADFARAAFSCVLSRAEVSF